MSKFDSEGADLRRLESAITIMTLCGICSPIYSELHEPILIELIEETYGEPMATSSGHGSCGSHSYSWGGVAGYTEIGGP